MALYIYMAALECIEGVWATNPDYELRLRKNISAVHVSSGRAWAEGTTLGVLAATVQVGDHVQLSGRELPARGPYKACKNHLGWPSQGNCGQALKFNKSIAD